MYMDSKGIVYLFEKKDFSELIKYYEEYIDNKVSFKGRANQSQQDNVLFKGLAKKTKQIMENEKCKKTIKF